MPRGLPMRNLSVPIIALLLFGALEACTFDPQRNSSGGGEGGKGVTVGGTGGSHPCENLECRQSTCTKGSCTQQPCAGGGRTTVSGTIFDPAGKVPLQGITVYIPNKALDPIADGPSCDPCDPLTGTSLLSGSPIAIAKTDVTGKFTLGSATTGGDVPSG